MRKNDAKKQSVAEVKFHIVYGIVENVGLHQSLDSYKNMPAEEKIAYLEGIMSSLWAATH